MNSLYGKTEWITIINLRTFTCKLLTSGVMHIELTLHHPSSEYQLRTYEASTLVSYSVVTKQMTSLILIHSDILQARLCTQVNATAIWWQTAWYSSLQVHLAIPDIKFKPQNASWVSLLMWSLKRHTCQQYFIKEVVKWMQIF